MSPRLALLGSLVILSVAVCAMGQSWEPALPRQFSADMRMDSPLTSAPVKCKGYIDVPLGFARTDVFMGELGNARTVVRNGTGYTYLEAAGTEICTSSFQPIVDPWWWLSFSTRVGLDSFHKCYVFGLRLGDVKVTACLASPTIPVYQNVSGPEGAKFSLWFSNIVTGPQSPFLFELPPACALEGPATPDDGSEPDWWSVADVRSQQQKAQAHITEATIQRSLHQNPVWTAFQSLMNLLRKKK